MLYPKDALSLDHRTDALSKWKYGDVLIMFLAFMSLIFSINVMLLISDDELATSSVVLGKLINFCPEGESGDSWGGAWYSYFSDLQGREKAGIFWTHMEKGPGIFT